MAERPMLVIGGVASGTKYEPHPSEKFYTANWVSNSGLIAPYMRPSEPIVDRSVYRRFRIYSPISADSFEVWIPTEVSDRRAPSYICHCAALGAANVDPNDFADK